MVALKQVIKSSPFGPLARRVNAVLHALPHGGLSANTEYDLQTWAVMRRVIGTDSNCIDIGAHAGSMLREIVALAPRGHHSAFEPLPHLAQRLRADFPAVDVREQALGREPGRASFQYVLNAPAYSGLRERVYDRPDPQITQINVEVVRLDDVIDAGRPIRFIKLDIEGGEYHALQGGARLLHRWRPVIVFEAGPKSSGAYGVSADDIFGLLHGELGYALSTMRCWLHGEAGYDAGSFRRNWAEGPDYYFIAHSR